MVKRYATSIHCFRRQNIQISNIYFENNGQSKYRQKVLGSKELRIYFLAPHWGKCLYTTPGKYYIERISQYHLREEQDNPLTPTLLTTDRHSPWLLFFHFGLRLTIHLNYKSIVLLRLLPLLMLGSLNRRQTDGDLPGIANLPPKRLSPPLVLLLGLQDRHWHPSEYPASLPTRIIPDSKIVMMTFY